MLQQRIKESSSLSLSTSYRYSPLHLFVLAFTLSLQYFMADTVLGTTDRRKHKMKKKKTTFIKLIFDKRCKRVSCHIVTPKYCLKPQAENVFKTMSIVGDFKIPPKSYESLAISVMDMINSETQDCELGFAILILRNVFSSSFLLIYHIKVNLIILSFSKG